MESIKSNQISINIPNYSGPLEVLLDLAKNQKVDLADISITQLIHIIREEIDYNCEVKFDTSKPDGTMLKLLDISKIKQFIIQFEADGDLIFDEIGNKIDDHVAVNENDAQKMIGCKEHAPITAQKMLDVTIDTLQERKG